MTWPHKSHTTVFILSLFNAGMDDTGKSHLDLGFHTLLLSPVLSGKRTQHSSAGLLVSATWKGKVEGSQVQSQFGKPSQTLSQN